MLVIVATTAREREPEESGGRRFGHVGQQLVAAAILFVKKRGRVLVRAEP
jgi:hypothetical protein